MPKTTKINQNTLNGPSFYLNKKINKNFTYQKALFGKTFNKRFTLKNSRLTKLKINEINLDNIRDKNKNIDSKKHEKKLRIKLMNLKDFYKFDKKIIQKYNNIKSFSNDKFNKNKINVPVYDIIELKDNKVFSANKLFIEECSKNLFNNFDCHSLMKFPDTFFNDSIFSSYLSNSRSKLKQFKYIKNKGKYNKIDINKLKITNLKGLEKMRINHYNSLNETIARSKSMIKTNRENYKKFMNLMSKTFNKHEEEVIKSD